MTIHLNIIANDAHDLQQQLKQLASPLLGQLDEQKPEQLSKQLLDQKLEQKPEQLPAHDAAIALATPVKQPRTRTKKAEAVTITAPTNEPLPDLDPEDEITVSFETTSGEDKVITRDDLKALIKDLHHEHGDPFLPNIQAIMSEYGARKQSEVKEEDIPAVYARVEALGASL